MIAGFGAAAALIVGRTGALQPGYLPALTSVAIWSTASIAAAGVVLVASWRFDAID